MSLQQRETHRRPAVSSEADLTSLHARIVTLVESKAAEAADFAREYCQLATKSDNVHALAHGSFLLSQALLNSSDLRSSLEAALLAVHWFTVVNDCVGRARSEALLGKIKLGLGDVDDAEVSLETAIRIAETVEDRDAAAIKAAALNHLGAVRFNRGDIKEALLSLEQSLDIWKELEDFSGQVNCLTNIGSIQSSLGQFEAAITTLTVAFEINCNKLKDHRSEGFILLSLSRAHALSGDHTLAIEVTKSALNSARLSGDSILIATSLLNLGSFCLELGSYEESRQSLIESVELSRHLGFRSGEMSAADSLGLLELKVGHVNVAKQHFLSSLALALELDESQGELESRLHLADVELSLGNLAEAEAQVMRSLELAVECESPKEQAEAHRIVAALAERQGEYRRAFEHSQQHLRIKDLLFNTERDRQTRNLSIQFEVERARHDANVYRVRTEAEQEARLAAEQLVKERTAELAQAHQEVVTRLAMAAEYRDDTTGEHTRRVGRAAARIARGLGWPEERARILGVAARLHDVGKIGIPDSILLKAGKLTVDEYEQMKSHTLIGSRILSGGRSDLLRMAEEIALSHHERWDGRGYPFGLSGEAVPLTGRIVALADVFDALTQDRPYKRAWTSQEALAEIKGLAGTHFDPALVDLALEVLALGGDAPMEDGALDEEDASHLLNVFEQLQVERLRDVEEARLAAERSARELERMARTDVLTSLLNRRAFETDLEAAVRAPVALWVVSCDLDGLKATNDALGYGQGDGLLQRFAGALERVFAGVGRAYRMGGDEFAVIGSGAQDDASLRALMDAVLREAGGEGLPRVSASVGVARTPDDAQTPGDLLRESDRRMYADKLRRRAGA